MLPLPLLPEANAAAAAAAAALGGSRLRVQSSTPPSWDATSLAAASTVALDPGILKQEASRTEDPELEKGEETEAENGEREGSCR